MALSLESIYKPVNDFFTQKFKFNKKDNVIFVLEQSGTPINKKDFMPPNNPEEIFSDLVNEIPQIANNGMNVSFISNNIDDTYEQVLNALPFWTNKSSELEKQSIEDNYAKIWMQAKKDWEVSKRVKGGGIADTFLFSEPSPLNWIDNDSNIWETHKIEIKESKGNSIKNPNHQILKIRMNDAQLSNLLTEAVHSKSSKSKKLSKPFLKVNAKMFNPKTKVIDHRKITPRKVVPLKERERTNKTVFGKKFSTAFHHLKFNEKILVKNYIKEKSPTKPIQTNKVNISFKYCTIRIRRDWFSEGICNINKAWYIPGMDKGSLTNPEIGAFTHLSIAFVAVKNLKITANWSDIDKEGLKNITSFGPFDVNDLNINENGSLSREGIQIIGWMLQKTPVLPPN